MFESIRTHKRWMMFFMMVLIIPSFVFFGIQGYNRFIEGDNALARVGGQPITPQEFEAAQRERLEQLRQMFGANFDAKLFDTAEARAQTLDMLIGDRALASEVAASHLRVSEERIREVVAGIPAFQKDGRFNYEQYKTLLAARGMNELLFEHRLRADLARQTLLQGVAESAIVPKELRERLQRVLAEQREVRELKFRAEDFVGKVKVADEAIKAHYEKHRSEFTVPENAKVEYVVLSLDEVAARINVAESDLRAYYEQNRSRYGQEESRRASHILLTAGEGGSAKDKAAARKLAEELRAKLAAGADFAKLAREHSKDPGSGANGGDLGFFGRNMMVKPFEEAAFRLKEGELSEVVETDFGFHIIRLTAIRPAQIKAFETVRAEIELELKRQQAQKRFAEAAETFTNTVYEQSDSLQPVVEKLKLKVQVVDALAREAGAADQQAQKIFTPRLLQAVFSEDAIQKKRNTEAVEVAPNTLAAARIVEHRPAKNKPLDEVRDEVRRRVEREEAIRLAREAGAAKLEAVRTARSDAGFGPARSVSRSEPGGVGTVALNAIMQAPAEKLPTYVGAEVDGGYAVYEVLSAQAPAQPDAQRREAQQRALAQQLSLAEDRAYLQALKDKHKAEILRPEFKDGSN